MKDFYPKSLIYRFDFGVFKGASLLQVYEGGVPLPQILVRNVIEKNIRDVAYEDEFDECGIYTDGKIGIMYPNYRKAQYDKSDGIHGGTKKIISHLEGLNTKGFELFEKIVNNASKELNLLTENSVQSGLIDLNELKFYNNRTEEETIFSVSHGQNLIRATGCPSYIEWCIKNVEYFFVTPDTLDALENTKVQIFVRLKALRLGPSIFKIQQFKTEYTNKFSESTKELNNEKYTKYRRNIESEIQQELSDYMYGPEPSRRYSDQDFIDDAFGGEASAYWNID